MAIGSARDVSPSERQPSKGQRLAARPPRGGRGRLVRGLPALPFGLQGQTASRFYSHSATSGDARLQRRRGRLVAVRPVEQASCLLHPGEQASCLLQPAGQASCLLHPAGQASSLPNPPREASCLPPAPCGACASPCGTVEVSYGARLGSGAKRTYIARG
jgi:hypothetical protein